MLHVNFKKFVVLSMLAVMFLMLAPESWGAENISILTSQAKYKDVHRKMADAVEQLMDVKIDFQVVPDDQYFNLLKTKLATQEVPDIFMHNAPTEYITVRAQETCVELSDQPWADRMANPDLLKDEHSGVYAMPEDSSSFFSAAYYNKKVFDELGLEEPQTYAEFLDVLETAKQAGIIPFFASNKDSWTTQIFMTCGFPVVLTPKQPDVWSDLQINQLKFSDVPEFEAILSDYLDLYTKGYVNKDHMSAGYDDAKNAVATGKALLMYSGEFAAKDIKTKYPDVEIGSFIVPFGDQQLMATGKFVQGYYVPKGSGNEELALEVLNQLSQPEVAGIFYKEHPGYPGFVDVDGGSVLPCAQELVDDYIKTNKYVYEMNAELAIASPIYPELWKLYQDMVSGGLSPKEVLQAWDEKFTDFMIARGEPGWE